MKHLITALISTGILISCNSSDKKNTVKEAAKSETVQESTIKTPSPQLSAIDTDAALIATAVMAAPEKSRANCKVIGYNMAGEFVTLREGDNEFIVLADDPKKAGFSAACYHKDLDPFMARGRALKSEGKSAAEIFDIREEEAKSGKLAMGNQGSTLHIYFGGEEMYDPKTAEVSGAQYRYVVYLPFATAESTGLPERPIGSNHPWIMNPGTHRAHIMITPLADSKE